MSQATIYQSKSKYYNIMHMDINFTYSNLYRSYYLCIYIHSSLLRTDSAYFCVHTSMHHLYYDTLKAKNYSKR